MTLWIPGSLPVDVRRGQTGCLCPNQMPDEEAILKLLKRREPKDLGCTVAFVLRPYRPKEPVRIYTAVNRLPVKCWDPCSVGIARLRP